MTFRAKLWTGVAVLALLSPLGIALPALFGAGGAWGEWSGEEIGRLIGFVPEGMKRLAERWTAPLPDYALPQQGPGSAAELTGYAAAGIIGVAVTAGCGYALARALARRGKRRSGH